MEQGKPPADTLILTHPPYSLEEDAKWYIDAMEKWVGGRDPGLSSKDYRLLNARQTLHARLQTLINIVQGVVKSAKREPAFATLQQADKGGMVHHTWKAQADRDNRGKVYLYFSPEDMTVALENVMGIGWQGVPDHIRGTRLKNMDMDGTGYLADGTDVSTRWLPMRVERHPLAELGNGFYQRIFTGKRRPDPVTGKVGPLKVGLPPHDVALRLRGEDDHAHVEKAGRSVRADLPFATWPIDPKAKYADQRRGIRRINGEPLAKPCLADMAGKQIDADKIPHTSSRAAVEFGERGPCEAVDPIDAAIAVASGIGLRTHGEDMSFPDPNAVYMQPGDMVPLGRGALEGLTTLYNQRKGVGTAPDEQYTIINAIRISSEVVNVRVQESVNAAKKRWQSEVSGKSFHGVIIGSAENHRQVTAYDLAIGSGKASTDPRFYAYLCAVADWRIKKPSKLEISRPSIMEWPKFIECFSMYWAVEKPERKKLVEGNVDYYGTGELPKVLPLLGGALWSIVVSEITSGGRVTSSGR